MSNDVMKKGLTEDFVAVKFGRIRDVLSFANAALKTASPALDRKHGR